MPDEVRLFLNNELKRHGWLAAASKGADNLRSAAGWLTLAASALGFAAFVLDAAVGDSAPRLTA